MFERLELLIGKDNLSKIKNKTILVVGVGGVGGYTVTSLVRSGIENIIIIDYDIVDVSNINRQIIAYYSTIGLKKVDVLEKMLLDINRDVNITKYDCFLDEDLVDTIFSQHSIDYVIDACDSMNTKKAIIKYCLEHQIAMISCMGTGNKLDPSQLEITELRKTSNDPVARILRKWVKDNHITGKIPVVCSKEVPKKVGQVISSNSFVPASAGLLITGYVVNDIIKE